ncbi:MAG: hypothetical protein B6U89_04495 [Desulfurococcales archaeon ex4484_58]|nr:MAG: hypothetical protein B6U89_04495 [Desulfurococcales archaeon ex4484_58]
MWLFIIALYLAFMNSLDLLFNLTALKIFNFSIIELGFFNGLWILTYICFVRIAGKFVDQGLFKKSLAISVFSIVSSMIIYIYAVDSLFKFILYASYMIHAVAVSFTRLAASTSILEYYESSKWDIASKNFTYLVLFSESILLIMFSMNGFQDTVYNSQLLLIPLIITGILSIKYIPQPTLMIERTLFSIEKNLSKMLIPVHASLSLGYQSINTPSKLQIINRIFNSAIIKPSTILVCLIALRISNEYVLTPLPYHMFNVALYTPDQVLFIYGFAKLLSSFLILFLSINIISRGSRVSAIIARLISAFIIYLYINNTALVIPLLALILYANALLDSVFYTLYIESTHGYRTEKYSLVNEVSGFTGSLTSGVIYLYTGTTNILILILLTTILFLSLIVKPIMKTHRYGYV